LLQRRSLVVHHRLCVAVQLGTVFIPHALKSWVQVAARRA
jgi:hypothetical protein